MATHAGESNGSRHAEWRFARAAKEGALAAAGDQMSTRAARFKISASMDERDPRPVLLLAHGDPSVFPAFRTAAEAEDAVAAALRTGKFNYYYPAEAQVAAAGDAVTATLRTGKFNYYPAAEAEDAVAAALRTGKFNYYPAAEAEDAALWTGKFNYYYTAEAKAVAAARDAVAAALRTGNFNYYYPAEAQVAAARDAIAAALRTGKFNYYPAGVGLPNARRVLTTIDTVMRSRKCIGRAREAAPTGHSHAIPTFARAGDCSLPPSKCDWFLNMGSTVINTDGSCVISSALMSMVAQYRRFNMKYDGSNSWFFKVPIEAVQSLKYMCDKRGAWKPYVGAPNVHGVLEVIRSLKKGIPTVYDNISLRLKSYVTFEAGDLSPLEVTSMIQKKGPVIGILYAGGEAYFRSTVYRGDRAFLANHAVVCTGYRYVDGELCIIIMDNVARAGPFRFVLCEAFEEFHVLTVDTS